MDTEKVKKLNPVLSVVIPTLNGKKVLEVCLDSLQKNLMDTPHEIIVIDNGSTDGTQEMLKGQFPQVILIQNKENKFYAASNNQGFAVSKGRYILALNNDTEIIGNILQRMIEFMDKPENLKVGACNCNIYFGDGSRQLETDYYVPTLPVLLYRFLLSKKIVKDKIPALYNWALRKAYYKHDENKSIECEALMGAVFLARSEAIKKLNGFDEKYVHWFTDDELCIRMRQAGYKLLSLPYEKVIHHHGVSNKRLSNAGQVFLKDFNTYLRDKLGWPSFVVCYPLFKSYTIVRSLLSTGAKK